MNQTKGKGALGRPGEGKSRVLFLTAQIQSEWAAKMPGIILPADTCKSVTHAATTCR